MASMSSADLVAYVIERYLETYPEPKPINPLDFRAAVRIVTELVREQFTKESSQNKSAHREDRFVGQKESRSSSMLASVLTTASQYLFPEHTPSEEGLEQTVSLQNGASIYGRSTCDLLRMGFPFATVSYELGRKCLIEKFEGENCYSFHIVVQGQLEAKFIEGDLRPGTIGWTRMETMVNAVSGDIVGKVFLALYAANGQQNPLRVKLFHILLKMTIWDEYVLPETLSSEALNLKNCFEMSVKGVECSKHQNPLQFIEIVLATFPHIILTNDGFRTFVLQMLRERSFVDWPSKEKVLIAYLELRHGHVKEDATFLASSRVDDRTSTIGQNILNILFFQHQYPSSHFFSQLMRHLPLIPEGWMESVFKCSYPKFNGLCRDFHLTPPCVRRVNLNPYSPVLVIGDLVIGLYEGRGKAAASETFWTCVAYHIKTENVIWKQTLHLHDVQDWLVLNTPFGVAIPKQNSKVVECFDVATGIKNVQFELPNVFDPTGDQLYFTPAGYIYYYCRREQKLFGAYFSDPNSHGQAIFWKEMDYSHEVAGFSGHFIIYKKQNAFDLVTPSNTKHSFLDCQHLFLFGRNLVRFEGRGGDEMEVIIQEIQDEGDFVLSSTESQRYTVPFGHVQQVSIIKDMLVYSTLEGIYFVDLQNGPVNEIKRPISFFYTPLIIDPETGIIWMWDRTERSLYKGTQEGFERIGQLTSSDHVKLLFARDEKLYIIG